MKKIFFLLSLLTLTSVLYSQNYGGFEFCSGYKYKEMESNLETNFGNLTYKIEKNYFNYRVVVNLNPDDKYITLNFEFTGSRSDNPIYYLTRFYCSNVSSTLAKKYYSEALTKYGTPDKGYEEKMHINSSAYSSGGTKYRHVKAYLGDDNGILIRFGNWSGGGDSGLRRFNYEINYHYEKQYLEIGEPFSKDTWTKNNQWKLIKEW